MTEKTFKVTLHQLNTYVVQAENEEDAKEMIVSEPWGSEGNSYVMYMDVES